jgi:hypothetical protein
MNILNSSSNSSIQNIEKHNYKYDEYGFLKVNSLEDLLYDKFNKYMENYIYIYQKNKLENRKRNDNISNKYNLNCLLNNDKNKSMKIIITKKKNKDNNNIYREKENAKNNNKYDTKNNDYINDPYQKFENVFCKSDRNNIDKYYIKRKNKIKTNTKENIKNEELNSYINEKEGNIKRNRNNSNEFKKENIKTFRNTIKSNKFSYEQNHENHSNKKDNRNKNYSVKRIHKDILFKIPNLSQYYMTKINKESHFYMKIKKKIPIIEKEYITKNYIKKFKKNNFNKNVISLPESTLCYFERTNKIIVLNSTPTLKIIKNNQYFITKQIIKSKKEKTIKIKKIKTTKSKSKKKNKIIKSFPKIKNKKESSTINIRIINPKNSSIVYDDSGKIDIKASWNKINKIDTKKINNSKLTLNPNLTKRRYVYERKIISPLNPLIKHRKLIEKTNNTNIKINTLKTSSVDKLNKNKKFKTLYKYKIPIKAKFRNNMMTNNNIIEFPKNKSRNNLYKSLEKIYDQKQKNESMSSFRNINFDNYLNFPAIDSYFN